MLWFTPEDWKRFLLFQILKLIQYLFLGLPFTITYLDKHFTLPWVTHYLLYGIDALLAIEDASLQVEAGDGGGPISVFTGSCLLSGLEEKVLFKMKECRVFHNNGQSVSAYKKPAIFSTF